MVELINVKKIDDVYIRCECEASTSQELTDYFTFNVPNAKFHPLYKNKVWDGKIRIFNYMNRTVYAGLLPYVIKFCKDRDYKLQIEDSLAPNSNYDNNFGYELCKKYSNFSLRDYQNDAIVHALNEKRALMVSPTASGKSLMIYLLIRHHIERGEKVLIIVPTTSLVYQMKSDFEEYNGNQSLDIHTIMSGKGKDSDADITISTWQSIYKLKKPWFSKFKVVVGDEAHLFKAKSLTSIMTKLINCPYRYGFTGTLDGTETNKLVLIGLFGNVKQVVSTSELMDKEVLAKLNIKILVLKYPDETCKNNKSNNYHDEIDYIVRNDARNNFIRNLATNLEGNSLLLFQFVEKHGKVLYDLIKEKRPETHFVYGGVESVERENIRKLVEDGTNNIIVASYGTFSTGINIRNLHNVVFCSPSKSRIRNLQSIGRGLRRSDKKNEATLYDIVDDLSWKNYKNYALKHFMERSEIYSKEGFDFKLYSINLKE